MAVAAIPKGCGVRCQRLGKNGCTIYEDRPAPCREWSCAWLTGRPGFEDSDRPDRLGAIGSVVGAREIVMHEGRPGVLEEAAGAELVQRLVASGETVTKVSTSGRQRVVGPDADAVRRRLARFTKSRR